MNRLAWQDSDRSALVNRSSHPRLTRSAMINGFGIFTPKLAGKGHFSRDKPGRDIAEEPSNS